MCKSQYVAATGCAGEISHLIIGDVQQMYWHPLPAVAVQVSTYYYVPKYCNIH